MRAAKAQTSLRIRGKSPAPCHIHNESACRGCEFKISKALEMIGTSRNSLYLPHVCRSMYPDFVSWEDEPAHHTVFSAPLFLEQNMNHFGGQVLSPKLSAKLVCHSLFGEGWGPPRSHPGSGTANSISSRQRDRVMDHGHV